MSKARDLANAGTALGAVTATELGYVDGVTSAIQTQIDTKAPSSTAVTLTDTQTLTNKTLTNPVIASVINNSLVDAKGDVLTATADNTPARLAVGANDTVLTADSTAATGLKWATPAAGGMTQLATGTLSGVEVSLTSISGAYKDLLLVISGAYVNTSTYLGIRINNVSTATYGVTGVRSDSATNSLNTSLTSLHLNTGTSNLSTSVQTYQSTLQISNYTFAGYKTYNWTTATDSQSAIGPGWAPTTAAVTSIQIRTGNGTSTFSGGTYTLYGIK